MGEPETGGDRGQWWFDFFVGVFMLWAYFMVVLGDFFVGVFVFWSYVRPFRDYLLCFLGFFRANSNVGKLAIDEPVIIALNS